MRFAQRAKYIFGAILLSVSIEIAAVPSSATTIEYTVQDLGNGSWQYSYNLIGNAFGTSAGFLASGFDVYFDPTQYTEVDFFPTAPNMDWLVFTTQPDPSFPADGVYTAQALVDNASPSNRFTVSFAYSGTGTPGAQPFDVFDPAFGIAESGTTVLAGTAPPPVPEPASFGLVAAGLLAAGLAAAVLLWRCRPQPGKS